MRALLLVLLALPLAAVAQMPGPDDSYTKGTVMQVLSEERDDASGFDRIEQTLLVQLKDGSEARIENSVLGGREDMLLHAGDTIVVERVERVDGTTVFMAREPYRLPAILFLAVLFFVLAVAFAGWTGFTSIIGLCVSILILALVVVPQIGNGADPLLLSFIGSVAIACTSLYLAHGFNMRTSIALVSTLLTLTLSLILSIMAVHLTRLFGMGSEETMYLQLGPLQAVNLKGLLLGGIVIGALGVLDDITTTQTAAIGEIKRAHPGIPLAELYRSGLRIGREHIASLVNTLALAYVGASLPLLLLFWSEANAPWWVILNSESIVEEIVRTLVGSMTLVLAVPISTWFACRYAALLGKNTHRHAH